MTSRPDGAVQAPGSVAEALRARIRGGGYLLLDDLSARELEAMQSLIFAGEAEIVNSACRPYVVASLDRLILPP